MEPFLSSLYNYLIKRKEYNQDLHKYFMTFEKAERHPLFSKKINNFTNHAL